MTLLTHDPSHSYLPVRQARKNNRAETPAGVSREGMMRGFFRFAVTTFLGTAMLAGIIALKTWVYLSHFNQ